MLRCANESTLANEGHFCASLELRDSMQDAKGGQGDKLVLQVELPTFPHAVVYQQAATAPATPADMAASSDCGGPTLSLIPDPEVPISQSLLRPDCCGRPLAGSVPIRIQ